jgi:nucleoside-specific outer membrane channel protein Tsx
MRLTSFFICLPVLFSLLTPPAFAEQLWSSASFSLLRGEQYRLGDSDRTIVTFEHVSGHDWGDTFLFIDRLESDDGTSETYGEFNFRYGLHEWSEQTIKKLYFAVSAETGEGFTNYLYGLGLDWDIPGFTYFQTNLFLRNNDFAEQTEQLTVIFAMPAGPLLWDGFIDFASAGTNDFGQRFTASTNFTSQLKYDLAPTLGLSSPFYAGVEYVFWQNKFGIKGINERNVNLLLKWHF